MSDSALILGNKNGSFDSDGVSLQLSRQVSGLERLHKITLFTLNSGVSATERIYISSDFVGWALVGFSIDAANNKRTVFCSANAAWAGTSVTDSGAFGGHITTEPLYIGRGDYTHSVTGKLPFQIGFAWVANSYLEAADIAAITSDAELRMGISLS